MMKHSGLQELSQIWQKKTKFSWFALQMEMIYPEKTQTLQEYAAKNYKDLQITLE